MNSLEKASAISCQMRAIGVYEADILKWFREYNPQNDNFAVLYRDGNGYTWYCNSPDYKTALQDIFGEMPNSCKMSNPRINEYLVYDGKEYSRNWLIFGLTGYENFVARQYQQA